jgi:hypothetical protein
MICANLSLAKIDPVVLEKKSKMSKFKDRQTDSRTTGYQKSSLELSAQVS